MADIQLLADLARGRAVEVAPRTLRGVTAFALAALAALAAVVSAGCSSQPRFPDAEDPAMEQHGRVPPSSEVESQALKQLDSLAPNASVSILGRSVRASAPYAAASGRLCRRVEIGQGKKTGASTGLLACRDEREWHYVPDVFAAPREDTP
jgi:hypothetical protein